MEVTAYALREVTVNTDKAGGINKANLIFKLPITITKKRTDTGTTYVLAYLPLRTCDLRSAHRAY